VPALVAGIYLLEILDPQRFTRGFPVEPGDVEPVRVRRLKSDLRRLGAARFPCRIVAAAVIDSLSRSGKRPLSEHGFCIRSPQAVWA
jgi:hypothetical protein